MDLKLNSVQSLWQFWLFFWIFSKFYQGYGRRWGWCCRIRNGKCGGSILCIERRFNICSHTRFHSHIARNIESVSGDEGSFPTKFRNWNGIGSERNACFHSTESIGMIRHLHSSLPFYALSIDLHSNSIYWIQMNWI